MPIFFATLLSTFLAATSAGQSVVPPDVDSVVSGGYWTEGDRAGFYRVVVVNSGYEHVVSHVFVQWVADPKSSSAQPELVASVEPALSFGQGNASLGATLKPLGKGRVRVVVSGVISTMPSQHVSATITATSPGHITVNGG